MFGLPESVVVAARSFCRRLKARVGGELLLYPARRRWLAARAGAERGESGVWQQSGRTAVAAASVCAQMVVAVMERAFTQSRERCPERGGERGKQCCLRRPAAAWDDGCSVARSILPTVARRVGMGQMRGPTDRAAKERAR